MRCVSPWYNRTGWLGVKHQLAYLLVDLVMRGVLTPVGEIPHCRYDRYYYY